MVDNHCFVVTLGGKFHLINEPLVLINRVVELRVGVSQFFAVDHQFEAFGQSGFAAMHLCERRHLHRIIGDERRLDELSLAGLTENLVNEFAFAHVLCIFYSESLGKRAQFILAHGGYILAGLLLDSIQDRQAAIGRFEINLVVTDLNFGCSVDSDGNLLEQLLGERHHPVVVLVLDVQLHTCELGVVAAVHTFVAEVTSDLIHSLKSAYDKAFEVELGSDTQVHIHVKRVMVRDERSCTCSACNSLQNRCLDLGVSGFVKHLAHSTQDSGALEERIFNAIVDHQIDITLTIALLGIVESVVCHTVLVLDDRQRTDTLGEHGQALGMHADLTHLGAEHKALNADKVADVQQFLEHGVVHLLFGRCRLFAFGYRGLYIIAADIDLNTSFRVLQLDERGFAHDSL